jgi:FkbM family methyltransferase
MNNIKTWSPLTSWLIRNIAILWAKSDKASGWLYLLLEKHGHHFPQQKRVRQLYNGLKIECDLRDHVQQQIYFFGIYEPIETYLLQSCITEGDVVIDAGANIGIYSLLLSNAVGVTGSVHSFEPVPENFKSLTRNREISGNPKQLKLNNLALWNKLETLEFSLSQEHEFNVGGFTAAKVNQAMRSFSCQTITLDQYVEEQKLSKVSAIKMDIEGAEKFALDGAIKTISKHKPLICMEINPVTCEKMGYSVESLIGFFNALEYNIFQIGSSPETSGWINNFQNLKQCNALFIHKDSKIIPSFQDSLKSIRRKYLNYS